MTDGSYITSYGYDRMGQLIRANDQAADETWVYEYDYGGNIVYKQLYNYTSNDLGPLQDTITYTYDSTWKDKLISYDGVGISYDDIGNVTNDGTYTYTWEAGHQLASMSKAASR